MINVCYSGNLKVFDGMLISLLSMAHNTKESICAFILTGDFTDINPKYIPIKEKERAFLENVIQKDNKNSKVYLVDLTNEVNKHLKDSLNLKNFYTPYALLRIFLDGIKYLPNKIIYMDVDTIVMGDIEQLYDIDISSHEFAGVRDYLGKVFINHNYINSGVLLLNLKKIRNTGLFIKCRHQLRIKKFPFPDQDTINAMCIDKVFLPSKFNDQRKLHKDTIVRHYCKTVRWLPFFHTINVKPWDIQGMHEKHKVFVHDKLLNEYLAYKKAYE
jgi:lipopolysaccharide biosynthesis glycosyltransferase